MSNAKGIPRTAGDENFPVASWLLPTWSRPHVMAFYAFARFGDDIADAHDLTVQDKLTQLQAMSVQLDGAMADTLPQVGVLRHSLNETDVTSRHAQDLLKAFMWDAEHPRTANWSALMTYCDLSAAPVGRYLIDVFGGCDDGYKASDALCAALQILNHLQDIKDDYVNLNRIYVPDDWMSAVGMDDMDLSATHCAPGLRRVVNRMLDGVDVLLDEAKPLPKTIRSRALAREAGGILAIAWRLAKKLRTHDPLAMRVELSKPVMGMWFLWGALRA